MFDLVMPTHTFHFNWLYLIIDPVAFLGNIVLKYLLEEVKVYYHLGINDYIPNARKMRIVLLYTFK